MLTHNFYAIFTQFLHNNYTLGIRKRMENVYEDENEVKSTGTKSTVIICKMAPKLVLEEIPGFEKYYFSDVIKSTQGRCTNIYGSRTMNACSHVITGYKYLQLLMDNEQIFNPVPGDQIYTQNIRDISKYIYTLNNMDVPALIQYIDDCFKQYQQQYYQPENNEDINEDINEDDEKQIIEDYNCDCDDDFKRILNINFINNNNPINNDEIEDYNSDDDVLIDDTYAD